MNDETYIANNTCVEGNHNNLTISNINRIN